MISVKAQKWLTDVFEETMSSDNSRGSYLTKTTCFFTNQSICGHHYSTTFHIGECVDIIGSLVKPRQTSGKFRFALQIVWQRAHSSPFLIRQNRGTNQKRWGGLYAMTIADWFYVYGIAPRGISVTSVGDAPLEISS